MDRGRPQAHPRRRSELVPHQRQQRRDQQGRAGACLPQQLRSNEVDEALSPTRPLNNQEPAATLDNVSDSLLLAFAKTSIGQPGPGAEQFEGALGCVGHGRYPLKNRQNARGPSDYHKATAALSYGCLSPKGVQNALIVVVEFRARYDKHGHAAGQAPQIGVSRPQMGDS